MLSDRNADQRSFACRLWALLLLLCAAPGCVIVQPVVSNPLPNVTRVAIVPFVNQSTEPAADVLMVSRAYFSELQKVPGFEVVPISVTARKIEEFDLRMRGPRDALELARILDVDAVVLGAITEYDPYKPPRIGLHVEWYSPHPPTFAPGIPVNPYARPNVWQRFGSADCEACGDTECSCDHSWKAGHRDTAGRSRDRSRGSFVHRGTHTIRGQSPSAVIEDVRPMPSPAFGTGLIRPGDVRDRTDYVAPSPWPTPPEPEPVRIDIAQRPSRGDAKPGFDRESPFYTRPPFDVAAQPPAAERRHDPGLIAPSRSPSSRSPLPAGPHVAPNASPEVPPPVSIEDDPLGDETFDGEPFDVQQPADAVDPGRTTPRRFGPDDEGPPLPPLDGPGQRMQSEYDPQPPVPGTDIAPVIEPSPPAEFVAPPYSEEPPVVALPAIRPMPFDPHEPIMAYTRMFDAKDADLVARLRDYVELNADERAGGWQGYLQRSDDFARFTAHVMIAEMLTLHGGETKRRYVFKLRTRTR